MSTKSAIARPHPEDRERWNGIYVGHDGYPCHVGRILFTQVVTHFTKDVGAAAVHYIDAHPAGWDFLAETVHRNECHCHDRGEGTHLTWFMDEKDPPDWTYVLRPEGLEIRHFSYGYVTTVPWDAEHVDWSAIQRLEV